MSLLKMNPKLKDYSTKDLLKMVSYSTLYLIVEDISKYYTDKLPLANVMNFYGITNVDTLSEKAQVPCLLLEHGSRDNHASARYFKMDRETGAVRPSVYCYKCDKLLTSFWYVNKMEKDYRELDIKDVMLFIKKNWGVEIPKDLILNFDLDNYYSLENLEQKDARVEAFKKAIELSKVKQIDPVAYLEQLKMIYIQTSLRG